MEQFSRKNCEKSKSEEHLYFGINAGNRLTADDFIEVMQSIGLSETTISLYPDLMEISRNLARARQQERSIIVGKYRRYSF